MQLSVRPPRTVGSQPVRHSTPHADPSSHRIDRLRLEFCRRASICFILYIAQCCAWMPGNEPEFPRRGSISRRISSQRTGFHLS